MEEMIELEKARKIVLSCVQTLGTEKISLVNSYHRVLGQTVRSPISIPPFARSPLDGYAYQADALALAPLRLKVVSEIPAGSWPERPIGPGEAALIFTGAPLPVGANCVVKLEDTEREGEHVLILKPVLGGANVVPRGDEIKEGDVLLEAGTLLTPQAVGLLAAVGLEYVEVFRRPRVGLFSTGSELLEAGQPLLPGKIYNSNSYTLRGLIQEIGCDVTVLPVVPDRLPETLAALKALQDMDVIITTGGASVGDYDLLVQALEQFGCKMLFWKVNMKPGTPVSVGVKDKQVYFSLSGNPAAAMVSFEVLVRPALQKYTGNVNYLNDECLVRMSGEFKKSGKQRRFLRAKLTCRDGEIWADPAPAQGSGILRSMVGSHLLVDVPSNHGPVKIGEQFKAQWIKKWEE